MNILTIIFKGRRLDRKRIVAPDPRVLERCTNREWEHDHVNSGDEPDHIAHLMKTRAQSVNHYRELQVRLERAHLAVLED